MENKTKNSVNIKHEEIISPYVKRGKFLAELRNSKKLTQEELGDKLGYTHTAISKWERGLSFPIDPEILKKIANLFDVSIEEILYGEKKDNKNSKDMQENLVQEYSRNFHKLKGKLSFVIGSLLFIIIIFMIATYLIFIRNSISLYSIDYDNANISIENSTLIISNKLNIFNFNKIINKNDKVIQNIELYSISKKNQKLLLFSGENKNYYIQENNGYSEYNLNKLTDCDLYLKIKYEDDEVETIKLNLEKKYTNDNIFPEKVKKINNENNNDSQDSNMDTILINEGFVLEDDIFKKEINNNVICTIYKYNLNISITIDNKNEFHKIDSRINSDDILYEYIDQKTDSKIETLNIDNSINCDIEKCNTIDEYAMYIKYLKELIKTTLEK